MKTNYWFNVTSNDFINTCIIVNDCASLSCSEAMHSVGHIYLNDIHLDLVLLTILCVAMEKYV